MYITIKEIMEMAQEWECKVVDFWQENRWAVIQLSNGVRIKIEDFRM